MTPTPDNVSEARLRELADMTKHFATACMDMWNAEPVGSKEVASMARELLSARTSTAPVADAVLFPRVATVEMQRAIRNAIDEYPFSEEQHAMGVADQRALYVWAALRNLASPPPPQPGAADHVADVGKLVQPQPAVTVTEEMVRVACDTYEWAEQAAGHPMSCRFGAMQDALRAALAAHKGRGGK